MYYSLENKNMKIIFTNLGASIVKWEVKNKNNNFQNIILSNTKESFYLDCPSYNGNTIGPISNRVSNGKYKYDNKYYLLDKNENNIQTLHSGKDGFSKKVFDLKFINKDKLCFSLENTDLVLDIIYSIDNYTMKIDYIVDAKKVVPISLTNHCYFNLGDSANINSHYLKIYTNKYLDLDDNNCTNGNINTLNTFNNYSKINTNKYDYGFAFDSRDLKPLASLKYNSIQLDIESTMDNIQVYTGDYLSDSLSKFRNREAIALEPQRYPNAVNIKSFPQIFVEGQHKDVIIYKIKIED